jgi:hypothetical protein
MDCVWLASDRDGYLAAFITAGIGPVPVEALESVDVPVEEVESLLCEMPKVSQAKLLVSVKRPDDLIDLAERGVFVYDWTDVHRTARDAVGAYEQVAAPANPIQQDRLPDSLAALAKAVKFADVRFADQPRMSLE